MTANDPASTSSDRCPWCGAAADHAQMSCPACGAALKFKPRRDDSGWVELPPIKDMARLRIGASTCQIEGEYVPVVDFNLAAGDGVYFAHHVMLWRDVGVRMQTMPLKGALRRFVSGLPVVMTEASGPGHIAFSSDIPGEIVAIPLQPGQSLHVREHAFIAATRAVSYDWQLCGAWFQTGSGKDQQTHYAIGRFIDEFSATNDPGLLLLHGGGNVFVRDLGPDEWLFVKPASFLFKDPSVRVGMITDATMAVVGYQRILWLQLVGPGRIGIQSAYPPLEGEHEAVTGISGRVSGAWEKGRAAPAFAAISGNRGDRARQLLTNSSTQASIPRTPTYHLSATDYRVGISRRIAEAMVDGELPPGAMSEIEADAAKRGLSAHDLRMLINHVKTDLRGGGRNGVAPKKVCPMDARVDRRGAGCLRSADSIRLRGELAGAWRKPSDDRSARRASADTACRWKGDRMLDRAIPRSEES